MLKLDHLTARVGDKTILNDVSFDFEEGKVYAVMGKNGSGKSTLASSIMGHPAFELDTKSSMTFNGEAIHELEPHERAQLGIFLSFQSPLSLGGVNIYQLLRYALQGKKDPLTIRKEVKKYAKMLKINEDLLSRSLNEDFSGGEKKKMEVLQALVLNPKLIIFDEIDTGVDVDALKIIAEAINKLKGKEITFIVITHYNRILTHLEPDEVLIIEDGQIVKTGDSSLSHVVESDGYEAALEV